MAMVWSQSSCRASTPAPTRRPGNICAASRNQSRVRDQRFAINPYGESFRDLSALQEWTDRRLEALSHERRCPATGSSVAEAWQDEVVRLTLLPETLPDPFDAVATRRVGVDGLVAFEGRQYSVPFRFVGQDVEVRGAASTVQILKACATVAVHPRRTAALLVIDQAHYDGPSTDRVSAPPPLGRMGARIQELATAAVASRSIDLYADRGFAPITAPSVNPLILAAPRSFRQHSGLASKANLPRLLQSDP